MSRESRQLRIGFIPLADATSLIVMAVKGFAKEEGLEVELIREVSWSNIRDKLNIGLFDAAHLLSPVAIASSLGLSHVKVPIVAPFNLGVNGNAITVTNDLYAALSHHARGDLADPKVTARALADVVMERRRQGKEPLNFGMTFPFSTHNYQTRFWMASGGVDPDQDVRMVVLPPPYMVESISSGHVDAFCVGAPWNSVAVELGVGHMLHFGTDLQSRLAEKVLALREPWVDKFPRELAKLLKALSRAADFVDDPANIDEVAALVSQPQWINVQPELIRRTLKGHLKIGPDGTIRKNAHYIMMGNGATRPDPVQPAWLYAQMVRWGHAPLSKQFLSQAKSVFRPDLYDSILGKSASTETDEPLDRIGAFAGASFDPNDIAGHLSAWKIRRW